MARKRDVNDSEVESESHHDDSPLKKQRIEENDEENDDNANEIDEDVEKDLEDNDNVQGTPIKSRRDENNRHDGSPIRNINPPGKPAEAGIIQRVYVENFMCHRKLTINLCRNVNFIHGQNGSGKSAILAAIQICLGAGAKRTHRARNLKDLVRKEGSAQTAKVRVTLLNKGPDAFQHDVYGDTITIERSISLSGGYNGYKLLDHEGVARSKAKKDLDTLLDQLNIQVENPVAVLDQEEAKKFLCGKAEDKYAFFSKATELDRLDRQYMRIFDRIEEIEETKNKVEKTLLPQKDQVEKLKKEWEQFEVLEKMEDKLGIHRVKYAWSLYWECKEKEDEANANLELIDKKLEARRQDLAKAEASASSDSNEETILNEKMQEYTAEAEEATQTLAKQESELQKAKHPLKQHERTLNSIKKDMVTAKRRHQTAVEELNNIRNEIMRKAGSAQSEEARRTAKRMEAESKMNEIKAGDQERQLAIKESYHKYKDMEIPEQSANEKLSLARRQLAAVQNKLKGLKSSEGNSMAMFGNKCVNMHQRVEQAKKERRFRGPVIGPIGHYLKVADGKEYLAALVSTALTIGLDRFIVTNDHDRSYFMKLRNEIGCNSRECLVIQTNESARYNVRSPPEGVESAATVLNIANDLVFNCLVDSAKIDQIALMKSKEESQSALLIQENGRYSIRGGNIKEVHFLPDGDNWRVLNGAVSMSSNRKGLRRQIGVDRTTSIRETENEVEQLSIEIRDLTSRADNLKKTRHEYKVRWNNLKKEADKASVDMRKIEETIERLQEEADAAENITVDTKEYEDDVAEHERACDELREKETEVKKIIDELLSPIRDLEAKVDETKERSLKVTNDLNDAAEKYKEYMRSQQQRDKQIEKKRNKVTSVEELRSSHIELLEERCEKTKEAMIKAQKVTHHNNETQRRRMQKASNVAAAADDDDEISQNDDSGENDTDYESIKPVETNKPPDHWKGRIQRGEKEIQKERERRQLSETNPEVALQKYQRARNKLAKQMKEVKKVEHTQKSLVDDLKDRKRMWKGFRSHISEMANNSFDEILNTKGSSGFIEFDHKNGKLNLVVQKDNRDEMTQTNDVKALSGGERSFTTLSLLLALGESLETPFRVMDEFDVFLDPVARKIALENLITLAKSMENRQFIFITPQDLSNIKTDPKLKIFHLKPPARSNLVGGVMQQTLDFETSQ